MTRSELAHEIVKRIRERKHTSEFSRSTCQNLGDYEVFCILRLAEEIEGEQAAVSKVQGEGEG